MAYKLITAPSVEPITMDNVKSFLNIPEDDNSSDSTILEQMKAARQKVEDYLGRPLITQTREMAFKSWPEHIYLEGMPVQSITLITYIDDDGTTQTLSTAYYSLDDYSARHKVYLNYDYDWPSARCIENSIKVRYVAGYGDSGDSVPSDIIQALYIIIGNWIRYKPNLENGLPMFTIPHSALELLDPHRVLVF